MTTSNASRKEAPLIFAGAILQFAAIGYLTLVDDLATIEVIVAWLVATASVAGPTYAANLKWRSLRNTEGPEAERPDRMVVLAASPGRCQRIVFAAGLAPLVALPLAMTMAGWPGWLELDRLRSLAVVLVVVASFASILAFYVRRQALAPARKTLWSRLEGSRAEEGTPPIGSSALVSVFETEDRLSSHLLVVMTLPIAASILLCVDAASQLGKSESTEHVVEWATTVVDALATTDGAQPIDARIASALPDRSFWPVPLSVHSLAARDAGASAVLSDGFLAKIDRELAAGASSGVVDVSTIDEVGFYRHVADGTLIIATANRSEVEAGSNAPYGLILVIGLGLLGGAFGLSKVVGDDTRTRLSELMDGMALFADGNAARFVPDPVDDAIGQLGRCLHDVGVRTRRGLEHSADEAREIRAGLRGLEDAIGTIASANAEHGQRLRDAGRLVEGVRECVAIAIATARELNSKIDDSNESVVILDAGGGELRATASALTEKVEAVAASLDGMVGSVRAIESTTDRLAEASEETSSSMEEMASAMRAVDTSAATTANLSRDVVAKAEDGQAKVVQTIAGMEAIREATDAAERVIRGLGDRTNEIGGILDVIDDVADETNLLALNAAIIAAQAGEQGKAFSVVAEEIKELADRVLASTKEIGGLIRAVQEESENAIGAIEAGSESVMSGVDLSAEAGRTLEEITDASRESGTRIGEIVASVREQTKAASHVVNLMERVRESAEQISSSVADQQRGNEIAVDSARAIRDVVGRVLRTTEEQSAGVGRMRENVDGVRGSVGEILHSLGDQVERCETLAEMLTNAAAGSRSNEEAARSLREAMAVLATRADALTTEAGPSTRA